MLPSFHDPEVLVPASPRSLRTLFAAIDRLAALVPGRRDARAAALCQRRLLACLRSGGARPARRLIRSLKLHYPHSQAQVAPRLWLWRLPLVNPRRALDVTMHARGIYFSYGLLTEPSLREKRRHALQERFYARWLAVGARAYAARGRPRLSPGDRLVLLVGELEADVHNGGFEQYLLNKGRRRARSALAALRRVRARRTAALLAAALDPRATPRELDALDRRFHRLPEDLAVLVMARLGAARDGPARAGSGRGGRP
jgi:hypothetical protein